MVNRKPPRGGVFLSIDLYSTLVQRVQRITKSVTHSKESNALQRSVEYQESNALQKSVKYNESKALQRVICTLHLYKESDAF